MKKIILKDKLYKILKWVLATAIAPTITLITGLGKLYGFDPTLIVGTIGLVASFLGALLGISNHNYQINKILTSTEIEDSEAKG